MSRVYFTVSMPHNKLGLGGLPTLSFETNDHTGGGYEIAGFHPSTLAAMLGKGPKVEMGERFDLKFNLNAKRTSLALVVVTTKHLPHWEWSSDGGAGKLPLAALGAAVTQFIKSGGRSLPLPAPRAAKGSASKDRGRVFARESAIYTPDGQIRQKPLRDGDKKKRRAGSGAEKDAAESSKDTATAAAAATRSSGASTSSGASSSGRRRRHSRGRDRHSSSSASRSAAPESHSDNKSNKNKNNNNNNAHASSARDKSRQRRHHKQRPEIVSSPSPSPSPSPSASAAPPPSRHAERRSRESSERSSEQQQQQRGRTARSRHHERDWDYGCDSGYATASDGYESEHSPRKGAGGGGGSKKAASSGRKRKS